MPRTCIPLKILDWNNLKQKLHRAPRQRDVKLCIITEIPTEKQKPYHNTGASANVCERVIICI